MTEHLYPEDSANGDDTLINHFANLTWVDQVKNAEISDRSPEDYIRQVPDQEWQVSADDAGRHFVPADRTLLSVKHYEEFLDQRMKGIYQSVAHAFPEISDIKPAEHTAVPPRAVPSPDSELRDLFEQLRKLLERDGAVRYPRKNSFRFKKERVFAKIHFRKKRSKYLMLELRAGPGRVSDPDFTYWRRGRSSWGYTHLYPPSGIPEKVIGWIDLARDYVKSIADTAEDQDEEMEP